MSDSSIAALIILILSVVLLILEAIAEAGVISLSRSRARLLASRAPDNPRAQRVLAITTDRERALGSIAVGRIAAVAAGFSSAFYIIINELGFSWGAVVAAGVVGAFIVALIQSVPRRLAMTWPEAFAMRFAPAIDLLDAAFLIPAAALEAPARLLTRIGASQRELAPDPTDIEVVLEHEDEGIEADEREMIRGVMSIGGRIVREAMTPRPDIVALTAETSLAESARFVVQHGFSRIPVYRESVDNVIGVLYAKDVMAALLEESGRNIAQIAREPMLVPESKLIDDLLRDFRRERVHLAIVLDEYGGTAGLITLEDLLEEIVGEIADEYDAAASTELAQLIDGELVLGGRAPLSALHQIGYHQAEHGDYDTVAGLMFDQLGAIPSVGDEVRVDGIAVVVEAMDGRRIATMRARRVTEETAAAEGAA